jgi:hypothetical protein
LLVQTLFDRSFQVSKEYGGIGMRVRVVVSTVDTTIGSLKEPFGQNSATESGVMVLRYCCKKRKGIENHSAYN